jgi:UDP-GlcNAc:undecaprenyl-phosphate/decaprenyl-phosphate GlcNAc-1-phosphate transferase
LLLLKAVKNEFDARGHAQFIEDGMDAIATGVAGIIGLAYLALPAAQISPFGRIVAASVAGACLGFLPSNWPIAKIFLGDCGATILGFAIAFLSLDFWRANIAAPTALLIPLLAAAIPLLDAVFAVVRRLRNRGSPLQGDRLHIYDLIRAQGWPAGRIIAALYAVTATFAAIAVYGVRQPSRQAWIAAGMAVGLFLSVAIRLGSLRGEGSRGITHFLMRAIEANSTEENPTQR